MSPYDRQPQKSFWKTAVAAKNMFEIADLWAPKFQISADMPIAAYGSCFAQHFGAALRAREFDWLVTETCPFPLTAEHALTFNYGVFSSRTGNIYTTSMLLQWCKWAAGEGHLPDEIWQQGDRFVDPFRPRIEPDGFDTEAELRSSRLTAIKYFRQSIEQARVLTFTLGLTERWSNKVNQTEYPICPGTAAGQFDENIHEFNNMSFAQVYENLSAASAIMKSLSPKLKILLTVSPVPLTATAGQEHVLVATMHSKSILRSVAGQMALENPDVDYFPSYEIINSPAFRGAFFNPNLRNVSHSGVEFVMESFFDCQSASFPQAKKRRAPTRAKQTDIICEEELLAAFGPKE
ncbi:MAG: GSCFA domain-containing protein [Alphaproteobacteria bacterium]|nr:GSCFA domain-containing protein [Alphaproteobacteria bacterium]